MDRECSITSWISEAQEEGGAETLFDPQRVIARAEGGHVPLSQRLSDHAPQHHYDLLRNDYDLLRNGLCGRGA